MCELFVLILLIFLSVIPRSSVSLLSLWPAILGIWGPCSGVDSSSPVRCDREHLIELQYIRLLSTKLVCTNQNIRDMLEVGHRPSHMDTQASLIVSGSWEPLIHLCRNGGSPAVLVSFQVPVLHDLFCRWSLCCVPSGCYTNITCHHFLSVPTTWQPFHQHTALHTLIAVTHVAYLFLARRLSLGCIDPEDGESNFSRTNHHSFIEQEIWMFISNRVLAKWFVCLCVSETRSFHAALAYFHMFSSVK
jgi:hypothetical protein